MATKDFDPETWKLGLVREVLSRYGESKAVQSSAYSNFFSGGFASPASSHYVDELATLNELLAEETDPRATRWLKSAIKSTAAHLDNARIEEERRGY